jgi:hypothetical protein
MEERRKLLAYCMIYCGDCLGYSGVIAKGSDDFKNALDKY